MLRSCSMWKHRWRIDWARNGEEKRWRKQQHSIKLSATRWTGSQSGQTILDHSRLVRRINLQKDQIYSTGLTVTTDSISSHDDGTRGQTPLIYYQLSILFKNLAT
jgi:hypothetical protein